MFNVAMLSPPLPGRADLNQSYGTDCPRATHTISNEVEAQAHSSRLLLVLADAGIE